MPKCKALGGVGGSENRIGSWLNSRIKKSPTDKVEFTSICQGCQISSTNQTAQNSEVVQKATAVLVLSYTRNYLKFVDTLG